MISSSILSASSVTSRDSVQAFSPSSFPLLPFPFLTWQSLHMLSVPLVCQIKVSPQSGFWNSFCAFISDWCTRCPIDLFSPPFPLWSPIVKRLGAVKGALGVTEPVPEHLSTSFTTLPLTERQACKELPLINFVAPLTSCIWQEPGRRLPASLGTWNMETLVIPKKAFSVRYHCCCVDPRAF